MDNTISHGRAAEILGIPKYDLIEIYDKMGLAYLSFDIEEIEDEVASWKEMKGELVFFGMIESPCRVMLFMNVEKKKLNDFLDSKAKRQICICIRIMVVIIVI